MEKWICTNDECEHDERCTLEFNVHVFDPEDLGCGDGVWHKVESDEEPEVALQTGGYVMGSGGPVWIGGQYFIACECPGCKEKDAAASQLGAEISRLKNNDAEMFNRHNDETGILWREIEEKDEEIERLQKHWKREREIGLLKNKDLDRVYGANSEKDEEIGRLVKELAAEKGKRPAIVAAIEECKEYNERVKRINEEAMEKARQQNDDAIREAKEHSVINDARLNELLATSRKTLAYLEQWEPEKE